MRVSRIESLETMSNWVPDPQLQQLFSQLVTRAFEEARLQEVREQAVADAQLAARGIYLSGGNIVGRAERGQAAFRAAGRRSIDEAVKTFGDIYGTIPSDAVGWIREQLTARFRSYATSRAASFAGDPVGSSDERANSKIRSRVQFRDRRPHSRSSDHTWSAGASRKASGGCHGSIAQYSAWSTRNRRLRLSFESGQGVRCEATGRRTQEA